MTMFSRRWVVALAVLLLALLLVVPSAAIYYTDWLWYREVGYEGLFLRGLNAQGAVFAATFVSVFAFLYINFRIARGTLRRPHIVLGRTQDGRPLTFEGAQITAWTRPVAAVLAL